LAESLLQFFGLLALLIPLALGYLGIRSLFPGQSGRLFRRSLSGLLYLLVLSPLLNLVLERVPWRGKDFPSGGLLGELVSNFLSVILTTPALLFSSFVFWPCC